jgi:hypothetical protein
MSRMLLAPLVAAALAAGLSAQQAGPRTPHGGWGRGVAHYGKWAAVALAATFTALAAHEHARSNRVFAQLLDLCRADNANCVLGPGGGYADPAAERLYQSAIRFDHRARARLFAGQASLLLCAGLFVVDLSHHAGEPENIPFHGLALGLEPSPATGGGRLTLRVPLPGP